MRVVDTRGLKIPEQRGFSKGARWLLVTPYSDSGDPCGWMILEKLGIRL